MRVISDEDAAAAAVWVEIACVFPSKSAKDHAFTPPPRAWIDDRSGRLNELLAKRTESSALALRRLNGPVTLTPKTPEVGRPYFEPACKVDSLYLTVAGSSLLQGGGAGNRTMLGHQIANRRWCSSFRPTC